MDNKPMISRLWLGPKEMPDAFKEYGKQWQELNPDWEVKDWTFNDVFNSGIEWPNMDVMDDILTRMSGGSGELTVEAAVQLADVMGYNLISRFGGIYINTDIQPLRSLQYLFDFHSVRHDAYAGYEDSARIVNAVLGGPANHPFWTHVIEMLPKYYWRNPEAEMVLTTGPQLLTDCAMRWQGRSSEGAGLTLLAQRAFNAVHWQDIEPGGDADGKWELLDGMVAEGRPEVDGIVGLHRWGHRMDGRSNLVR